jgi:hypothetical protein
MPLPLPSGPSGGTEHFLNGTPVSRKFGGPAKAGPSAGVVAATPDCWGCGSAPEAAAAPEDCGPGCCGPECCCDDGCGQPYRLWLGGEYLLWWTKKGTGPALVTTSPLTSPLPGVLGAPGTMVLFSGDDLDYRERSGGRATLGVWFDCAMTCGLEGNYFALGHRDANFQVGSLGSPILARPFFDAQPAVLRENAELVAFPGLLSGSVAVASTSSLWGAEVNFRKNLKSGPLGWWQDECCWGSGCCCRWDLLCGVRFLELDENLAIGENLVVQGGGLNPLSRPAGAGILVRDLFETRNAFTGGQIGTEVEFRKNRCTLDLLTKVALGGVHEVVTIGGNTVFDLSRIPGAASSVQPGGLLAQPTNIGRYTRDTFAVVPEFGLKVGYQLTERLRFTVGYTFLYASAVARPADQIDRVVNATQLPSVVGPGTLVGAARPVFVFRDSDYWAQGVSLGLEYRY